MRPQRSGATETPFRLQGEVAGRERVFDLEIGELRVGSAADSDLRLPAQGVSRQHALLVVRQEGLVVEDRGSRNGTFVDGQRIRRAAATAGARLKFGSVVLTVQLRTSDDATIAIFLDRPPSTARDQEEASSLWSEITALEESRWPSDVGDDSSLRLLDEVSGALASGDLANALRCLGEILGCSGCCLVEVSKEGPPLVLHSWGLLASHPPRAAFEAPQENGSRGTAWLRTEEASDTPGKRCQIAVAHSERGRRVALILWRIPSQTDDEELLLRILVRVFEVCTGQELPMQPPSSPTVMKPQSLTFPPHFVAGSSPPLLTLFRQLERLAPRGLPVLLTGPTGVGKGVFAEILHHSSPRRNQPLISVNCAALPGELLEAELFGIGKGVATGVDARPGHFTSAEGGTLFLDEIGELPLTLQAKLLRALQEKEIQPLGGVPQRTDVRILAATNVDLRQRTREGTFRSDLYFRLAGYVLDIPPLTACREDLPLFARNFLHRFAEERGVFPRGLSLGALRRLIAYPWPGNIRELEHEMRRLILRADPGQIIDSGLLSREIQESKKAATPPEPAPSNSLRLKERIEAVEGRVILEALEAAEGIRIRAAKLLGISRNSLARRMNRLGLP